MDIQSFAQQLIGAAQGHNYLAVAALSLVGFVSGVRWIAPKLHGGLGNALNSDRGGAILVLLSGVLGTLSAAFVAGEHITIDLLMSGLITGVMAAGGWNVFNRILFPKDKENKNANSVH